MQLPATTYFKLTTPRPGEYQLLPSRIDIWQYLLDKPFALASSLLNEAEKERAARFYFQKHQRRFTMAHAIQRSILARYLPNTRPEDLLFTENNYGKPALCHPLNLQFNLSHSEELALLAIGSHHPVGIDLEYFSARPYQGIADQMFSHQENQSFKKVRPCLQPLSFFHVWAQKEAFIKACGLGLSYPTRDFDVHVLPKNDQIIEDRLYNQTWRIVSFMPQIACSAALCHHPSINEIRYIYLGDFNELTG